ncbi:MAG: UbiD family decarboxylase [Anaerolineaceae bacterium]|nr:UbiD family decarboxylase [Anaerolineaceae bacterium]
MEKIHDLRSFMAVLEDAGQLTRVQKPVNLVHELANVAAAVARQDKGAVIFTQPAGASMPVFTGAVASQKLAALALDCSPNEVSKVMGRVLNPANGIAPVRVSDAAWKENIITGDDVNLAYLPIPTHGQHDGGPFITGAITVAKDPVSGRGNLSYNRMQVLGKRELGFNMNEWRHTMQFYKGQENKNEPLQISVAIGLDPAIMIAAGARSDDDELLIAGAIRSKGTPVCKGVTVDIDIPAEAEIILEGYLPPQERRAEGPLAEFHGYYGEPWQMPVFHVTAICHRNQPIFQTIVAGDSEHIYIGNVLPREPLLLEFVQHVSSNITGVHVPPYGNGFVSLVQLQKSNPGEPKNVAMAAFTSHVNNKLVIAVDPDVNLYNPADILWALNNRVDWSRDIFLVPGAQGHEMDPVSDTRGVQTKIGIDATYKEERRPYGERIRYPDIDLNEYLS